MLEDNQVPSINFVTDWFLNIVQVTRIFKSCLDRSKRDLRKLLIKCLYIIEALKRKMDQNHERNEAIANTVASDGVQTMDFFPNGLNGNPHHRGKMKEINYESAV